MQGQEQFMLLEEKESITKEDKNTLIFDKYLLKVNIKRYRWIKSPTYNFLSYISTLY